jgi:hypothetical protein
MNQVVSTLEMLSPSSLRRSNVLTWSLLLSNFKLTLEDTWLGNRSRQSEINKISNHQDSTEETYKISITIMRQLKPLQIDLDHFSLRCQNPMESQENKESQSYLKTMLDTKDSGIRLAIREMAMEFRYGQTVQNMKVSGIQTKLMDKDVLFMLMVMFMLDIGKMTKQKEKVYTCIWTAHVMRVHGRKINNME